MRSSRRKAASPPKQGIGDLTGPLLVSLLAGQEDEVESQLNEAARRGADTAVLARDLVEPVFKEIGEMWMRGEVTPAEEHLATELISRCLTRRGAARQRPLPGAPRILLSCLAGEFHELGIRIAADIVQESGWIAESLGANVPRTALVGLVAERLPRVVGLSVALPAHIPECLKTIEAIKKIAPGIKVLVGGNAFRRDRAFEDLAGPDACLPDAIALRDWLVENRPRRAALPRTKETCRRVAKSLHRRMAGAHSAR